MAVGYIGLTQALASLKQVVVAVGHDGFTLAWFSIDARGLEWSDYGCET